MVLKKATRKKAARRKPARKKATKSRPAAKKRATAGPKKTSAASRSSARRPAKKVSGARTVATEKASHARSATTKKKSSKKSAKPSAKKPAARMRAVASRKTPKKKASTAASRREEAAKRAEAVRRQLDKAQVGTFDDLVRGCDPEVQEIARRLQALVFEVIPDAEEVTYLRWRITLYKKRTEICGIQPAGDRCNFYLTKGAYLHDPEGILEGTGKLIRHVKVRSVVGTAAESIRELLKQAVDLSQR